MLSVLAIIPTPHIFGLQNATLQFFGHLDRNKISTRFLVSHWNNGEFIKRLDVLGLPYDLSYLGFISKQLRWTTIRMTLDCMVHMPVLWFDLWRLMRRNRFDVIYVSGYHFQIQILPLLMVWRRPVVCHVHDYYQDSPFHKRLYRLLDRYVTRYVVVSDSVRLRMESFGIDPKKIEKIYNGIDLSKFDLDAPQRDLFRKRFGWSRSQRLVAFVGQIAPHKGPLQFVEAARIVCDQRDDVRMLIVGDASSNHAEELKQRVSELELCDHVFFCGFERNSGWVFSSIDILVVPSQKEDPAPLVAAEAMAAGKPVVVTRSGGLAELIEDGVQGFVVEKKDVEAIASAIISLLDDQAMAVKMGEAGRRKVEEIFSIDRQAQLLEQCLSATVDCHLT